MDLKGKKINFLGDSITEGCGTSGEDKVFHQLLKRYAGLSAARNYGVGGTRMARQLVPSEESRWDEYFSLRADKMDLDADVIVVFGGTNDYGHGDAPIGTFEARNPDTFYGACHELYRKLLTKYPDALIVVMTPLHRENDSVQNQSNRKSLSDYVDIIKEVAKYYSLPVLDLYSMGGIQPDVPVIKERFCPDGLHPNDAGHEIICSKLKGFLEAL